MVPAGLVFTPEKLTLKWLALSARAVAAVIASTTAAATLTATSIFFMFYSASSGLGNDRAPGLSLTGRGSRTRVPKLSRLRPNHHAALSIAPESRSPALGRRRAPRHRGFATGCRMWPTDLERRASWARRRSETSDYIAYSGAPAPSAGCLP